MYLCTWVCNKNMDISTQWNSLVDLKSIWDGWAQQPLVWPITEHAWSHRPELLLHLKQEPPRFIGHTGTLISSCRILAWSGWLLLWDIFHKWISSVHPIFLISFVVAHGQKSLSLCNHWGPSRSCMCASRPTTSWSSLDVFSTTSRTAI